MFSNEIRYIVYVDPFFVFLYSADYDTSKLHPVYISLSFFIPDEALTNTFDNQKIDDRYVTFHYTG